MLGKGLESLIPKKSDDGDNADAGDGNSSRIQGSSEDISNASGGTPKSIQPETPKDRFAEKPLKKNQEGQSVFLIEVEKIKPNPHQPRRHFNEEAMRDLAASIREFGIIQPLVVSKMEIETLTGADVEYQLIAGERRLLASKLLGLERVPAIIKNISLEREKLELAVIENIQRENLNPVERARAFAKLQEEFGLTQREIASRLGKSREVVSNTVRLLNLPLAVQEALDKGLITESHGRLLLGIEDLGAQQKLFEDLMKNNLSFSDLKNRVRKLKEKPEEEAPKEPELSPEFKIFQEKLSAELGAPVEIRQKGELGKITITFYSKEELENILNRLEKEKGTEFLNPNS